MGRTGIVCAVCAVCTACPVCAFNRLYLYGQVVKEGRFSEVSADVNAGHFFSLVSYPKVALHLLLVIVSERNFRWGAGHDTVQGENRSMLSPQHFGPPGLLNPINCCCTVQKWKHDYIPACFAPTTEVRFGSHKGVNRKKRRNTNLVSKNDIFVYLGHGIVHRGAI